MKSVIFIALALFTALSATFCQQDPSRQWPWYRGYMLSGVLDNARLPVNFDFAKNENILWKTEVPGLGLSSPVIWDNKLFITTAVSSSDKEGFKPGIYGDVTSVDDSSEHEWKVLCYDKFSGKMLWERTACTGIPSVKRHPKSSHANTSVATDGMHVVAFFGSEGLYCYDMNGKLLWKKSFGILKSAFFTMPQAEWEFASSPVIYNGRLIIQCDVLENSFLAAYDVATGREIWKTQRDEYPGWCTPNIYKYNGKILIAVNGYKHRGGYDYETGNEIWKMSGGGDIPIPSPVVGEGLVFFNSAHGKNSPIMAISTSAKGDITLKEGETAGNYVPWYIPRGGSYIHSMLLYNNKLYNVNWNGVVNCYDPQSGKEIYTGKIGRTNSFTAAPVASDGRIFIVDEQGTVFIISDAGTFQILAEIPIGENCTTSPAITDGIIFFRSQNHLYAVGKK